MRKLIYSMGVSLDGFIAGRGGEIDWSAPGRGAAPVPQRADARNRRPPVRAAAVRDDGLLGDGDEDPALPETELEFARIWQALPKIVFSTTLESVAGNARLVRDDVAAEVAKLKAEPGLDLAVGGAGLAASLARLGLIDEYGLFVSPVVLGGGTPFFPALDTPVDLELVETRTFGSRVVYLRYRVRPTPR